MSKVKNNGAVFYMVGNTTVCLLMEEGTPIARGISIYSRMDEFDSSEGRKRALDRAKEAAGRQEDCQPILIEAPRGSPFGWFDLSVAKDLFGSYKGSFKPELTDTEKLLLERRGHLVTGIR